jgi:hypothetical protein
MKIKCSVEECNALFASDFPLHPDVKYLCRNHTKKPTEVEEDPIVFDTNTSTPALIEDKESGEYEIRQDIRRAKILSTS